MELQGKLLKWIESFLKDRTQKVRVGSDKSNDANVLSGIPQGSILGPILFTIFINDLPDAVQSACKIFADDTKVYNTPSNKLTLQEDIYRLQNWSNKWNLYFNISKCGALHIGKSNPDNTYYMKSDNDLKPINQVKEEKDLGVTFDSSMTYDAHISRIVNKANQMLGIVKRTFSYLNKDVFLKLYKSFIRPHLEYANVIWCPYKKDNL